MITTEDCIEPPSSTSPDRASPVDTSDSTPRTFAELQGKMVFVQASQDPFNCAVSFSSAKDHRSAAAELMPDGYDDTAQDRATLLKQNPKDENAEYAPRREEIDEFYEASADLCRRQRSVASSNMKPLGARSILWPALDEADYDSEGAYATAAATTPKRSYANYGDTVTFDRRAEEAMYRGRIPK